MEGLHGLANAATRDISSFSFDESNSSWDFFWRTADSNVVDFPLFANLPEKVIINHLLNIIFIKIGKNKSRILKTYCKNVSSYGQANSYK